MISLWRMVSGLHVHVFSCRAEIMSSRNMNCHSVGRGGERSFFYVGFWAMVFGHRGFVRRSGCTFIMRFFVCRGCYGIQGASIF